MSENKKKLGAVSQDIHCRLDKIGIRRIRMLPLSSDSTYDSFITYNLVKKQKWNNKPIIIIANSHALRLVKFFLFCLRISQIITRLKVMELKAESECSIHKIIMLYASAYDSESDSFLWENQPSDDMKLA